MIEKCNDKSDKSEVVVRENGKTFRIINKSRLLINTVTIDGCYITKGRRCDYLFEIVDKDIIKNVFYVELKGKDIEHAVTQLEATIKCCKQIHNELNREAFIVASRVPKSGTCTQVIKKRFLSNNGFLLYIDTNCREVTI